MNANRAAQIPELNTLRLLALFFVVLNHLTASGIVRDLPFVSYATSPLLAIISGFLLFRNATAFAELKTKIPSRVATLAIPYLVWTFIYFVAFEGVRTVLAHQGSSGLGLFERPLPNWSLREYWFNYVAGPTPPAFWFLQNLILALPASMLLYPILRVRSNLAPCLIFIAAAYTLDWPIFFSARFLPYFILGAWMGLHQPEGPRPLEWRPSALWAVAALLIGSSRALETDTSPVAGLTRFAAYSSVYFVLFSALRSSRNSRIVQKLHKHSGLSFLLHTSHQLTMTLVGGLIWLGFRLSGHALPAGLAFELTAGALVFLATLWATYLLDRTLRAFAPWLIGPLYGNRHRPPSVQTARKPKADPLPTPVGS